MPFWLPGRLTCFNYSVPRFELIYEKDQMSNNECIYVAAALNLYDYGKCFLRRDCSWCIFVVQVKYWMHISNCSRMHSFGSIWIWILQSKIRFFIPFSHNPILDCNSNNPPPEADHSDWYLNLVLDCHAMVVWLYIYCCLKVTSTLPAGQQSNPIFDWRIQIQIVQTAEKCNPKWWWIDETWKGFKTLKPSL